MNIIKRFLKVVYVLFLLLGLVVTSYSWLMNSPYSYVTYTYQVKCENGKIFDPTSKPISKISDKWYYQSKYHLSLEEPFSFNENEIKSECEYGVAWMNGLSPKLSPNYTLTTIKNDNKVGSRKDQIKISLITFISYYLILEIIRRTLLFIFLGKNFLTLRSEAKN